MHEPRLHGVEEAVLLRLSRLVGGFTGVDVHTRHGERTRVGVDVDLDPAARAVELRRPHTHTHRALRHGGEHGDTCATLGLGGRVRDVQVPEPSLRQDLGELIIVGAYLLKAHHLRA